MRTERDSDLSGSHVFRLCLRWIQPPVGNSPPMINQIQLPANELLKSCMYPGTETVACYREVRPLIPPLLARMHNQQRNV